MRHKEKKFISVVIYVHNAEDRIVKFLETIIGVMEHNFEHSEIICVNDCSDDCSVNCIKRISNLVNSTSITILNMSYFHGIEMAMNAGVDLTIGDFVFEFDSTILDYDKEEIMNVYKRAQEGFDIVSASSDRKQKYSSKMFYYIYKKFTRLTYKMDTESFRILSRRVINRVGIMNKSIPYRKAAYAGSGLKVDNIIYSVKSEKSNSKRNDKSENRYRKRLAIDTLILFTDIGYMFSGGMAVVMMLCAISMGVYSLAIYLTSEPVEGWTTTILFLAIAFFGMFGILTIIIKYLQIIIELIFKRKRYNFESIEKITKEGVM